MRALSGNGLWIKDPRRGEWIGGYERVKELGRWVRKFTLVRIPVRGPVKKHTLYFSSAAEAKSKGWVKQ